MAEKHKDLIQSTVKSQFLELNDTNMKKPVIIEESFDIKGAPIKIVICTTKELSMAIQPWINIVLDDKIQCRYTDRLETTTKTTGSLLIQKPDGKYLTITELNYEIENLFGLYDNRFSLLFNNNKQLLSSADITDLAGKTIFIVKSLNDYNSKLIEDTSSANPQPFTKFINCEFNDKKFTVFLENPKDNHFNKKKTYLNNMFDQLYPGIDYNKIKIF